MPTPKKRTTRPKKIAPTRRSAAYDLDKLLFAEQAKTEGHINDLIDSAPIKASSLQEIAKLVADLNARVENIDRSLKEMPIVNLDHLHSPLWTDDDLLRLEEQLDMIDRGQTPKLSYEGNVKMPTQANGWITQPDGTQKCYKNGELHHLTGPAEIRPNGTQLFYKNGLLHRDGGQPAMTGANGTLKYAVDGKYHRVGGLPAITWSRGTYRNEWWINGEIVRAERKNGTKEWYMPGCTKRDEAILSRIDGPAVVHKNGVEEYWLNGTSFYSRADWVRAVNTVNNEDETIENVLSAEDPSEEIFEAELAKPLKKKTAKEEKKMSTEKPSLTEMMKSNFQDAAYRVAGTQATKAVKTAILTAMKNKGSDNGTLTAIAGFLDTEFGTALISAGLGVGLNYVPHLNEDPRVQRVAEELRIGGIAVAGNAIIGEAMAHILPAITDALKDLPALETPATNARVETKHESLAEHLEEETMEEENSTGKTMKA